MRRCNVVNRRSRRRPNPHAAWLHPVVPPGLPAGWRCCPMSRALTPPGYILSSLRDCRRVRRASSDAQGLTPPGYILSSLRDYPPLAAGYALPASRFSLFVVRCSLPAARFPARHQYVKHQTRDLAIKKSFEMPKESSKIPGAPLFRGDVALRKPLSPGAVRLACLFFRSCVL
jgi:hypothetical protein